MSAIVNLPGLTSLTFYETTGPVTPHTFAVADPQLLTRRADALSGSNRDFIGVSDEYYDVFYSDGAGKPDPNGDCVTIEAAFNRAFGGGGLNIAALTYNFGSTSLFASALCGASTYLGTNSIIGSDVFAVDTLLTTTSTMGSTVAYPTNPTRLRIILNSPGVIPEPATLVLVTTALVGLSLLRRMK